MTFVLHTHWVTGAICGISVFIACLSLLAQIFPPPIGNSWTDFGNGFVGGFAFCVLSIVVFVLPALFSHVYNWE